MTRDTAPAAPAEAPVAIDRLARFLISPLASPVDVSERRRAQVVAFSSLALSICLVASLPLGPDWLRAHMALLLVSVPSYLLSRTKYHGAASHLFAFGGVVYAYLSINLGSTPNLETAVMPMVTIWLIFASAILYPAGLAILGITATILTFTAPFYAAPAALSGSVAQLGWVVLAISSILCALRLYHDHVADARHRQLQSENRELERAKLDVELHMGVQTTDLEDRAQEIALRLGALESDNLRLEHQAAGLSALSQVIRAITSVRELRELLARITTVLGEHFAFYHVGIYLLDEDREYAILSAANGGGSQQMLDRGHRFRIGQESIVGTVAASRQPRVASDVEIDPLFLANPDLPDTRSEAAWPLMNTGQTQVNGVLDVQSKERDAFSDQDRALLGLLADQVGLAIENALSRGSAQRTRTEAEALGQQSLRAGWGRMAGGQQLMGYRFDITGSSPLTGPVDYSDQPLDEAGGLSPGLVGVPIELRGQVLGELLVHAPVGKKWNQDELDLIRAVAERVALSAENARLFEETNRRAERERMVSEITSKIRSTNDPDEMIKKAVQELKNALGVSRVEVRPQKASGGSDVYGA